MDAEDLLPIIEPPCCLLCTLKDGEFKSPRRARASPKPTSSPAKFSFAGCAEPRCNPQQIDSVLHAKTTIHSQEFFYDILDEHFSRMKSKRNLKPP